MASIVAIVVKGALSLTKVITEISKRVVQNGLATSKIRNGSALAIIKKLVSFYMCKRHAIFMCTVLDSDLFHPPHNFKDLAGLWDQL